LRIIGGKYGGRRINPAPGLKARPTTDFARESLFNILNNRIDFETVTILDLFSGTGSISFEFASRGSEVHLVEMEWRHFRGIKNTIKELGITNIRPIHIDVRSYLKTCSFRYDLIFADPPYDLPWLTDIPDLVLNSKILKEDGIFILEHPRSMSFNKFENFSEHRNYGGVNFSFFRSA
jgi:16S rRNA (guanine(966)-N(2))-methyltransferase RsmD